jgi:hypothetical protein
MGSFVPRGRRNPQTFLPSAENYLEEHTAGVQPTQLFVKSGGEERREQASR